MNPAERIEMRDVNTLPSTVGEWEDDYDMLLNNSANENTDENYINKLGGRKINELTVHRDRQKLNEIETRFIEESGKRMDNVSDPKGNSFLRRRFGVSTYRTAVEKLRDNYIDDIGDFFNENLHLESECSDRDFITYLIKNNFIEVSGSLENGVMKNRYELIYDGNSYILDTMSSSFTKGESYLLRYGIRSYYDKFIREHNDTIMKKAGILTAVGLSIIALITGLSVGLTRKGNDMVYNNSKKWKELEKADKTGSKIWTDLTDAAGSSLSFIGRYLPAILLVSGTYLLLRKKTDKDNLQ